MGSAGKSPVRTRAPPRRGASARVLRIIGGTWRGRKLRFPDRPDLRPTPDRVRETLFNWLTPVIDGARCLDLYAGTGALGIEALSRGAATAIFVDEDRQSISAIEKNLAKTQLAGRVRQQDVFSFLKNAAAAAEKFQIVFADPPYDKMKSGESFTEKLLDNETLPRLLEPHGVFVLEKRPSEELPPTKLWQVSRRKTYGATEVLFLSAIE